mgnify:CR=1 FL=1
MFKGSHPVTIDTKGRFAVPAAYRQPLIDGCGGRLVITRHWDGCLLVYPAREFESFEQKLLDRGSLDPKVRNIQRFFIGNARDVDMDRQGRVLLPSNLRESAGLSSQAVLSGIGNLFELWDAEQFEARNQSTAEQLAAEADAGDLPDVLMDISL